MRRLVAMVVVLVVAASAPSLARADDAGVIAVLPLTSSEKRLAIYGVPVARVLATELRGSAGAPVENVADARSLPARIAWVIDGRIVLAAGGKVVLEARLRDPARGSAFGQLASRPGRLTEIDQLARQLAGELAPLLHKARADRAAARAPTPEPVPIPPAIRDAPARPKEPVASSSAPADARPAMLVTRDR